MWSMRAASGRSRASRAAALRCPPSTMEFLNLIKGPDIFRTSQPMVRDRRQRRGPRAVDLTMSASPLGHTTRLLRFMHRFRFQHPETVVGVKNQVFVDRLAPFVFELAPHLSQLPYTDGGMGGIPVRNLEVLLELGIIKVDPADITRIAAH